MMPTLKSREKITDTSRITRYTDITIAMMNLNISTQQTLVSRECLLLSYARDSTGDKSFESSRSLLIKCALETVRSLGFLLSFFSQTFVTFAECPEMYTLNPRSRTCFKENTTSTDWFGAKYACESEGAYLATFDSLKSIKWLKKQMKYGGMCI